MPLTHLHHETNKSLIELQESKIEINVYIQLWCIDTITGYIPMGKVKIESHKGDFKVRNNNNTDISFTCQYATFSNGALVITFNLPYDENLVNK